MGLPNWVESLLHQYRGDGGGELPLRPGSTLPPPEDSLAASASTTRAALGKNDSATRAHLAPDELDTFCVVLMAAKKVARTRVMLCVALPPVLVFAAAFLFLFSLALAALAFCHSS